MSYTWWCRKNNNDLITLLLLFVLCVRARLQGLLQGHLCASIIDITLIVFCLLRVSGASVKSRNVQGYQLSLFFLNKVYLHNDVRVFLRMQRSKLQKLCTKSLHYIFRFIYKNCLYRRIRDKHLNINQFDNIVECN